MSYISSYFDVSVVEVHSGDDLVLMVDLGIDGLHKKIRARLHGVDTPNAYKASYSTEAGRVRDEVRKMAMGSKCQIQVVSSGKGGWLVILSILDKDSGEALNLNEFLCQKGYVYKGKNTTPTYLEQAA